VKEAPRQPGGALPHFQERSVSEILSDLRFAARALRARPGYSLVALVTLAAGVAAGTAVTSAAKSILLAPLPFPDSDRLNRVVLEWAANGQPYQTGVTAWHVRAVIERARQIDVTAQRYVNLTVTGSANPVRIAGIEVSSRWHEVLGVAPALGRGFSEAELALGSQSRVALVSHGFWQRQFGGRPEVLGADVSLNGTPYTVIGVMPARFGYPYHADVWFPTTVPAERSGAGEWNVVARLRPGATLALERVELRAIAADLAREVDSASAPTLLARPFDEEFDRDPDQVVMALLAGVALVLLIAGVNVSTLGLVRGAGRSRELAIRNALGASASAQIRLVLTESLLLSLVAGALGIALAWPLAGSLGALIPDRLSEVTPTIVVDGGAVLGAALLSAGVGLVAGLPAALAATRSRGRSLVAGGRTGLTGRRRRMLDGLVAAQVGLAMALLVAASALVRDFVGLMTRDLGYDRADVLRMSVAFTNAGYEERAPRVRLIGSILDRVRALPGVGAAGAISLQPIPFTTSNVGRSVVVEGDRDPSSSTPILNYRAATPDYFGTLGIRLGNGRLFDEGDRDGSVPVAVLSRSAARRLFPTGDAIGHRIKLARRPDDAAPWVDVVGIVADIAEPNPTRPASVYVPFAQTAARDAPGSWSNSMTLLVRGHPLDAGLIERVRQIVRQLDPDLPLYDTGTLATALEAPLADQRFGALLVLGFGAFALLMVALSTYGVVAFAVSGRLNEFGIRLALGAVPSTLRRQVVREAMAVVATGVGLGAVLALALAAPLSGALQEARVLDLTTWVGAGLVLLVAGGGAALGPARTAGRLSPIEVLRRE
jgi:putative ABC transport system permease protein